MKIVPFEMERYQSLWENIVDFNLSESGVHPLQLNELISHEELAKLVELPLGYNQTNGSEKLRELIAKFYPNANEENVLVTTGSAEANFLSSLYLLESGDEIALMLPNYMQIWGLAKSLGANVKPFHLRPNKTRWEIDWDEFLQVVTEKTKLIAVCHPNNPTGARLQEAEIERILEKAASVGAWVLSDEVYRGSERDEELSLSLYGSYDRVIVSGGLSKAFGLPGLRIGWVVGPKKIVNQLWGDKDYTTISPNTLSDRIAQIALQPAKRDKIFQRARSLIRKNFQILENWLQEKVGLFQWIPPEATAVTLVQHNLPVSSNEFVTKLRDEKSVLIVPGEQFLMPEDYLRIGFGTETEKLTAALNLVSEFIAEKYKK
ncbi:MAG: aminotransferase class I/II-fold pyridoxal phosphate-dependent enzyme [Calditrichaeota bacterium]|nr:aminotransferase class I/II-fold pyridoxal phosphate-dependent enzyme [Calditrichota bacterium]